MRSESTEPGTFFTIGHSTHDLETFKSLLSSHNIDIVVDLRSAPYSKQAPQFNRDSIRDVLATVAVRYLYGGRELGGRPRDLELYGHDGRVLYWKVADTDPFKTGIAGLWRLLDRQTRIALLCSEESPNECHRRLLVGRVLCDQGARLLHIRGNGNLEEESGVPKHQPSLFASREEPASQ